MEKERDNTSNSPNN